MMIHDKTLQQLSIDHLNDAIRSLAENTRLTNIAKVVRDKNSLLKLGLQRQQIQMQIDYNRAKIEAGE